MTNKERLFEACEKGSVQEVERLLDQRNLWIFNKINVNTYNKDGDTLLHHAVENGRKDIAEFLLARGAEINCKTKDEDGSIPLHLGNLCEGSREVAELLIAKGADVNARNNYGRTPLHSASYHGMKDKAELLIAKGAEVNARDKDGFTPLQHASSMGNKEVAELLIASGADVDARDNNGCTPLFWAAGCSNKDVVELLIAKGADVNAESDAGWTPLFFAWKTHNDQNRASIFPEKEDEYKEMTLLLVMNGATTDTRTKRDKVPLNATVAKSPESSEVKIIMSPEEFAGHAITGPVRWRFSIRQIPSVVTALNKQLQEAGVPSKELYDLFNNSLLSVCPVCNQFCSGKALLSMEWMGGTNVFFTGNSGGFERMLEGRCLNYSCDSTEHELFWCPDLNLKDFAELQSRGIKIDPDIQRTRDHVWKPKR
jgi:ankyrin repeat protein